MASDREHRVVALGPSSGGVDENVDRLIDQGGGRRLGEHGLDMGCLEDLLIRVEGQAAQLALDEIGSVLHYCLQFDMAIRTLPAGNQVQHVHTGRRLPVLDALFARQLDAEGREERQARDLVSHPEKAGVEVDFGCQGGNRDEARVSYKQEGGHGLVEETGLHVCRLLQHNKVPASPLGRRNLRCVWCIYDITLLLCMCKSSVFSGVFLCVSLQEWHRMTRTTFIMEEVCLTF